jgi:hypothetical protein
MTLTDAQLIALGLQIIEARKKGGRMTLQKYGKSHFSDLGKKSAEVKKAKKTSLNLGA